MSFSNSVRSELARVEPENICCRKAELASLLLHKSSLVDFESSHLMTVEVDNPALARKIYRYLKDIYQFKPFVEIIHKSKVRKNRSYKVQVSLSPLELTSLSGIILIENGIFKPKLNIETFKDCCKRAYIRGLFLSRGFVSRPEGNYHLEFMLNHLQLAKQVQKFLNSFDIGIKIIQRKKSLVLYIKESEQIADFLRIVEANKALLEFENVRILKSMRNSVNRQVNCETANLAKTIDASVRQMEIIKKIIATGNLEALPSQLRELAYLRLDHPEATLKELGLMLNPPLSKSGIAYRMRRLEQIGQELLADNIDNRSDFNKI